jgi:hypothetical protein
VETDLAGAGILFEIGGDIAEFEAHESGSCAVSGLVGSMCLLPDQNKKNKYRFIYNHYAYGFADTKKPRTKRGFFCAATTYMKL